MDYLLPSLRKVTRENACSPSSFLPGRPNPSTGFRDSFRSPLSPLYPKTSNSRNISLQMSCFRLEAETTRESCSSSTLAEVKTRHAATLTPRYEPGPRARLQFSSAALHHFASSSSQPPPPLSVSPWLYPPPPISHTGSSRSSCNPTRRLPTPAKDPGRPIGDVRLRGPTPSSPSNTAGVGRTSSSTRAVPEPRRIQRGRPRHHPDESAENEEPDARRT